MVVVFVVAIPTLDCTTWNDVVIQTCRPGQVRVVTPVWAGPAPVPVGALAWAQQVVYLEGTLFSRLEFSYNLIGAKCFK